MAFPTSLTNAVDNSTDVLAAHLNAVEAKIGIDGSAVTTSHDYKLSGVTGSDKAVSKTGSETLTNKTLTSPVINTPTGIVKGDVGLGNVDNTSDATKDAAVATLTNKTLTSPKIGTSILDTNGNELALLTATASAVNEVTLANAATGNPPTVSATGDNTNINLSLKGKGDGLVEIEVLRQNDTTNVYKPRSIFLTGWGQITAGADTNATDTVSFGVTFADEPIVIMNFAGQGTANDFANKGITSNQYRGVGMANAITTTQFTAQLYNPAGNWNAAGATTLYYTWIAIGELA